MPLLAIGLNHQHAPVGVREHVVFNPTQLPDALAQLMRLPGVHESAILSTCNRTELYLHLESRTDDVIIDWLAAYGAIDHQRGAEVFYFDRRARAALARDVDARRLRRFEKQLDSYMVCSEGRIATVGHRYQRVRRH